MKSLKYILLLQLLFVGLFFVCSEKQVAVYDGTDHKPVSELSAEGIHASAFIQPETVHHVVAPAKSLPFFVARISESISVDFAKNFKISSKNTTFQDINRCETVSLLLFPFHIFW